MNKQLLEGQFGYFRMVLGVTRRLVEQFPAEKLAVKPTGDVRSAAEIVVHNYQFMREAVDSVLAGSDRTCQGDPKITDKAELLKFMDESVKHFYDGFARITDAQLQTDITAYGSEFCGWQFLTFCYDEHWHHRGQLTVYLRLLGIEPVMIYSYQ